MKNPVSTNGQIVGQGVGDVLLLVDSINSVTPISGELDLKSWQENELAMIDTKLSENDDVGERIADEMERLEESVTYVSFNLSTISSLTRDLQSNKGESEEVGSCL